MQENPQVEGACAHCICYSSGSDGIGGTSIDIRCCFKVPFYPLCNNDNFDDSKWIHLIDSTPLHCLVGQLVASSCQEIEAEFYVNHRLNKQSKNANINLL